MRGHFQTRGKSPTSNESSCILHRSDCANLLNCLLTKMPFSCRIFLSPDNLFGQNTEQKVGKTIDSLDGAEVAASPSDIFECALCCVLSTAIGYGYSARHWGPTTLNSILKKNAEPHALRSEPLLVSAHCIENLVSNECQIRNNSHVVMRSL